MPKDPTKKPPAPMASDPQELEIQIRQRAYVLDSSAPMSGPAE